jgi:hypothetical protein
MSFTFGFVVNQDDTYADVAQAAVDRWRDEQTGYNQTPTQDTEASAAAGVEAAGKLIEALGFNADGVHYNVSVSGHANEGHVPASGWANDTISVSVTQMV